MEDEELSEDEEESSHDLFSFTDTKIDSLVLKTIQETNEQLDVTSEFVKEAIEAAFMVEFTGGDLDNFIAEKAKTIRSNLEIIVFQIQRDPVGFLLSVLKEPKQEKIKSIISQLSQYTEV